MKKIITVLLIAFFSVNLFSQEEKNFMLLSNELQISLKSEIKNIDKLVNFVWVDDGTNIYYPDKQKLINSNTISFWFNEDINLNGKHIKLMYYTEETGILVYEF